MAKNGQLQYNAYALPLPSGRTVLVRRPDLINTLGQGRMLFPLLSVAVEKDGIPEDTPTQGSGKLNTIRHYCEACLVSPAMPRDIDFYDVPWSDCLAIYQWAIADTNPLAIAGQFQYGRLDLLPIATGAGAIYLDLVGHRYNRLPSDLLGVDGMLGMDLDLAVAFRAVRQENNASSADPEVEVDDIYGNKHKVPRSWLPQSSVPGNAKVTDADTYAKIYGATNLSAGGLQGDGQIGPMPTPGSNERAIQ